MSEAEATARWRLVSARLDELLDLEEPATRSAALERLHAEDPELAAELAELLAAAERRDALLDRSDEAIAQLIGAPVAEEGVPETIGPWRVVGVLGEGGMGRVFAAERAGEGYVQRAAVKVVHGGGNAPLLRERFLAERRILAELEHPSIARMLDGGVAAGGAPYFAMERVDGERITDFCHAQRARVERRLELFLDVCAAVEHAHGKRVVHRDLKPSNVLVDGDGRVKLLDFGIAKLLAAEEEGADAPTLLRALTPRYAAPEQAAGGAITPATDVYALGVLLHELLAGQPPRTQDGLATFTVERALAGEVSRPPSLAVQLDASRPEGTSLARRLAGDLDRIVARAMARAPERRYQSASALAEDVRRHLAGEPIEARGSAPLYRAARKLRRHRWAALALVAAALALVLGVRLATLSPRRAPVLAVLPFLPGAGGEPYRSSALAEEVATALGRSRELAVLSSLSLGADRAPSSDRLRQELGATHALSGRIEGGAESPRLVVALEDLAGRRVLWTETYPWSPAPQPEADAAVVAGIAGETLATLGLARRSTAGADAPTRDPRAYEAYLRGVAALAGSAGRGRDEASRLEATVQLELAVALDPAFAPAWARLATVYAQRLFHDAPNAELEQRANAAIQWALALDPSLAEAYLARAELAWNLENGFPHARAVTDLKRAIELQPSLAEAHRELCKVYFHVGLTDRAVDACDRALALDPGDRAALARKLTAWADDGRFAEVARALAGSEATLSPGIRGGLLLMIRETEPGLALLRPAGGEARAADSEFGWPTSSRAALERAWVALGDARLGRTAEAAKLLARAEFTAETFEEQSHLHHAYYAVGAAHAVLGDRDEALAWLTKAADEGYPSYPHFAKDADLASLASDPRFVALLARLKTDWLRCREAL